MKIRARASRKSSWVVTLCRAWSMGFKVQFQVLCSAWIWEMVISFFVRTRLLTDLYPVSGFPVFISAWFGHNLLIWGIQHKASRHITPIGSGESSKTLKCKMYSTESLDTKALDLLKPRNNGGKNSIYDISSIKNSPSQSIYQLSFVVLEIQERPKD